MSDRAFWLQMRQALLNEIDAIERYKTGHLITTAHKAQILKRSGKHPAFILEARDLLINYIKKEWLAKEVKT